MKKPIPVLLWLSITAVFLLLNNLMASALEVGEQLPSIEAKDQFGKPFNSNQQDLSYLLVSFDMSTGKQANRALAKKSASFLEDNKAAFIANIHGMPWIGKKFALPKMRKYPHRIILADEAGLLDEIPQRSGQVTVLNLNPEGVIEKIHFWEPKDSSLSLDGQPGQSLDGETLVIALKPNKDPDKMLEERSSLSDYLETRLEQPVKVIVPLSAAVINEGFTNGTLDIAYLSSTGAINSVDNGIAEVLLAVELKGKPYYQSYWVSLKDKPYNSVKDLRGKPIAFSSPTSTSGFLIPVWDLYQKGLITTNNGPESFFGRDNVFYGVGYVSAIRKVLDRQVEAAAVSYYVLDEDRHLTRAERAKLKRVAIQGPVPTHTLLIRGNLNENEYERLQEAFLSLNENDPELRDKVFQSKLIPVNQDEHLSTTRQAINFIRKNRNLSFGRY